MVQQFELLGNKKLMVLLVFLARNPSQEFTYGQIKTRTKLAKATLTKWLSLLRKEDLISLRQIGLNKLYKINRKHCFIKQLKILFNLIDLQFLITLSRKYNFRAFLFGSASRGEDVEDSDYDILIIGEVKREDLVSEIRQNSKRLNKEIKLQVFSEKDWFALKNKDSAFYERVEQDKIGIQ